MRQAQIVLLVFLVCPTLVSCDNALPPPDPYALPAPPPAAPYSEDVNANATAVAANATAQAAYSNAVNARENARTAAAKGTVVARATDRALETRGTEVALMATSTAIVMQATLQAAAIQATTEANRLNQQATAEASRINQQATIQAQMFLVQATGMALSATGTAVAVQSKQERTAAEWESNVVMPAKKVGIVILIVLLLLALVCFGMRIFDALILRVRIIRDPSGHAIIVSERDRQGRQMLLLPNRAPGPVLQLAPPQIQPQHVSVGGADADVTQRAQVLEAMGMTRQLAPSALGRTAVPQHMGSSTQMSVLKIIPTDQLPPAQIADGLAIEAIDADWRRSDE